MLHAWIVLSALLGAVYPPHQDEFVNDFAGVIEPADAARIRAAAKASLDRGVPILAATIRRLADQGAADWSIERYATNLYNEWGIGDKATNRGVLLLVSVADRKLRIATGTGLGNRDGAARQVIDGTIVPRFKSGDFSGGIAEGVEAISRWFVPAAAAPGAAPAPPAEMPPEGLPPERSPNGEGGGWNPHGTGVINKTERGGGIGTVFKLILIVVGIGIIVSIFSRRSSTPAGPAGPATWSGGGGRGSGWGGVLLGGLAGFLGSQLLSGGRRSREWGGWGGGSSGGGGWSGGGGFSGGGGGSSFGGGSSSGGGASGTW